MSQISHYIPGSFETDRLYIGQEEFTPDTRPIWHIRKVSGTTNNGDVQWTQTDILNNCEIINSVNVKITKTGYYLLTAGINYVYQCTLEIYNGNTVLVSVSYDTTQINNDPSTLSGSTIVHLTKNDQLKVNLTGSNSQSTFVYFYGYHIGV